ncbi:MULTISPECIES: DUF6382 domain-containing protein [unclassified Paenibacillus]|uniref:DUF6382 domain-containing protein n=1 Tax=unclassified Paenibacillus TaxID=185978 RepID=UPI00240598D1|nr:MULTISPECIES: DUF6382 domain-containing protein [unclassified Paenibacillus]MDF9842018.1 hypothetical protein [Paenibacillus sp. PastF-2]MDF9848728.1 hypothetical protein [Paenibacillus sp. PastM-2]MDF9855298.1 hypothetical protein [Paenibacillus sp. PastF-1]MDH6480568.1 hypothetical protein [Paenibacillus sp. PastH-2]MDH6507994.1 hypothetical protein [Paenibacillus sp. PastM-3]
MFGLNRDFIQQDGISMQLGTAEGLSLAELNMVQAKMLMNTAIPHHLRLLLREIDLKVTLEYAVSRRKMLSHLLKSEKMSMAELFGLLLQIARGMEEGRQYMLRAEQYALHKDYIFIEGPLGSGKVFLTYIPLQPTGAPISSGEAVKSLIMVLVASVTELSGSGVQRLLQYCGSGDFSPSGLKGLLAELLAEDHSAGKLAGSTEAVSLKVPPDGGTAVSGEMPVRLREGPQAYVPAGFTAAPAATGISVKQRQLSARSEETASDSNHAKELRWGNGLPKLRLSEEVGADDLEDSGEPAVAVPSSYRTYTVLGAVLADALLWKFLYLDRPMTMWLAVCIAATVIFAAVSWMVWSGRIMAVLDPVSDESREIPESALAETRERSVNRKPFRSEWDFGRNPVVPARPHVQQGAEQKPPSQVRQDSGGSLSGAAGLVPPQPAAVAATALLTASDNAVSRQAKGQLRPAGPFLERTGADEDGAPEKIELDRASFIIGRSPDVAQYVEKSEGASRVHAEISRGPAGYIIKDLDSRNGTLYQGNPMIPYKEYPLTEGSVFTIIKGSYTFRTA